MWSFDVFPWGFQHKLFMYMFGEVHSYLAFSLPSSGIILFAAASKGLSSVNPTVCCKGYSRCFCRLWSALHNIVCKYGYFFPSTYLHYTGISYNTVKNKWSSFEKRCSSGAESPSSVNSLRTIPRGKQRDEQGCAAPTEDVCVEGTVTLHGFENIVLFSRIFLKKGQAATSQAF